ncbi:RIP metalloprotease [Williamsia sp. CHRR-6]|uniref:M50 family metallopeptidase n=1 Tax=Williamsia sp. CHRR-6 TaxID=2835871 RepID=UPI001BD9FDFF|nr:M50 family metallopeptidase [Williamsia sp. CHRR-6]MBT0568387.1 site-2 protease family protein [Williamsia sp. CHRR-6]
MGFILGAVLFAVGLLLSIAWHECGHMWAAQRTGMYVRRYFVGFGPTIWSTRRGETEYGLKWLPLGGFCDIAGMTTYDEIDPRHAHRAMYRQKAWKRLVVLAAGPAQNFVLGFVLIMVLAVGWGLPSLSGNTKVGVAEMSCISLSADASGKLSSCTGTAPAQAAGLREGDRIVAVDGTKIATSTDLVATIKKTSGPSAVLTIERDGREQNVTVPVTQVQRPVRSPDGTITSTTVGAIGVSLSDAGIITHYNVLSAVPGSVAFTGELLVKTVDSLLSLPQKVGALWTSVTGGERSSDTPISVYGASVIGGQAADRGQWPFFIYLLASINFFLGLFNLVPLLPLDGGHMALIGYEKARNAIRRRLGKVARGPVDYMKMMPATYAVLAVMGAFMVLTLSADIINPVKVF